MSQRNLKELIDTPEPAIEMLQQLVADAEVPCELLPPGPERENALLYLVVPPSLLVMTKSIPELSQAMITARVRTGRSDLVGVPILDLLTITPRK